MADTDNVNDFGLSVRRVGGQIGAEIAGVRLSGDLQPSTIRAIYDQLLRHKVIFFRGQHLTNAEHEKFATLLGEPVAHPTVPIADGTGYTLELNGEGGRAANSWHTDVTFTDAYPKLSILRAVTSPDHGGDTTWANTALAYTTLPDVLRELADKLWALHTNDYDYAAQHSNIDPEAYEHFRKVFAASVYETEHPLVRVHPDTNERTLVLGHFVKRIIGLSSHDSQRLFEIYQNHIIKLEHTVRWRWQEGDVAIWDNRATQHYAVADFAGQARLMRRVTVTGDVPVSVDGRRSVARVKARPNPAPQEVAA
jgi:alpha-ketoglutarate-dependent sulfate ester dioxygenase